jgi:hypothetical protein
MVGGTRGDGDGRVSEDAPEHAAPARRRRIRKDRRTTTGSVG